MAALDNAKIIDAGVLPRMRNNLSIAASVQIFLGAGLQINATNEYEPITAASGLPFGGFAEFSFNNSGSLVATSILYPATLNCDVWIPFAGITAADIGSDVYMTDDQTLTLVAGPGNVHIGRLIGLMNGKAHLLLRYLA